MSKIENYLQEVLKTDQELNKWFTYVSTHESISFIPNVKLELIFNDGEKEVVVLNDGLERIKNELTSVMKKYPFTK